MVKLLDKELTCPIPLQDYPRVMLAHGGGGRLTQQLIEKMFMTAFQNKWLMAQHDSSEFEVDKGRMALTTDSYVVDPPFFPGGDIGKLAVYGTVNDLAMSGAHPLYLSLGFILEEGFPMADLWRVVQSIRDACEKAKVHIITGDTKVVDKGKGSGLYLNTAGVGTINPRVHCSPASIQNGDAVLISGDVGRHGMAIMSVREGLEFETEIQSDCAPLNHAVDALIKAGVEIHCLRDLTRGGLASSLNELAKTSGLGFHIDEKSIPVQGEVQAACEILGLDPLYVANEGRMIAIVPPSQQDQALDILKNQFPDTSPQLIGTVSQQTKAPVILKSAIGADRVLDLLSGEQLPRIC